MSDSGAARRLEVLAGQLLGVTMQETSSSGSSVWANVPQVLLRWLLQRCSDELAMLSVSFLMHQWQCHLVHAQQVTF